MARTRSYAAAVFYARVRAFVQQRGHRQRRRTDRDRIRPSWHNSMDVTPYGCLSACACAAWRIPGSNRPPRASPAHPPSTIRSGLNRLIRFAMPAPRYPAVSSARAPPSSTGPRPRPARPTATVRHGRECPCRRGLCGSGRGSPPRRRTPQGSPASRTGTRGRCRRSWCGPHSPALLVEPRYVLPSVITAAPTPDPINAITACRAPRPAPNHISAWPWVLAPLSKNSGNVIPLARKQLFQRDTVPADRLRVHHDRSLCSTVPGTPTPMPSTELSSIRASLSTSPTPEAICATDRRRVGPGAHRVVDRGEPVHRQVEQLHLDAGLADVDRDPITHGPNSGSTRSSTRGRPPSDSTSPPR